MKKVCPLLRMTGLLRAAEAFRTYGADTVSDDCLEGECGWWDYSIEACAIRVLALEIGLAVSAKERRH